MKYRVNVTANDDGSKNWFDQITNGHVRYYEVDAGSEDEAREKARALSTAEAPQYKDLSIQVTWDEAENYTWQQRAAARLEKAMDMITVDIGAITPVMEAMEIAGLIKSPAAWSLRHYRERLGLTQDNVARAVGITPSNYARLERGDADLRKMSFGNAIRLANTLRITPDELFDCAGRV